MEEMVRPFQLKQSLIFLLAVLHLLPTCPTHAAASSQTLISPHGSLKVVGSIMRRASVPVQEMPVEEHRRSEQVPGFSSGGSSALGQVASGRPSSLRSDASLVALNSTDDLPFLPDWLNFNKQLAEAPPNEYLLFSWDAGGAWDGERNDLDAEVGFEFIPEKDMNITALGRHVTGNYRQRDFGGLNLFETTNVTLWSVLNETEKKEQNGLGGIALLSVSVGPNETAEVGGKYRFKYLVEWNATSNTSTSVPFPVEAKKKYRITQTCRKKMKDVWFDGVAFDTDIESYSLTECVKVENGVHSDKIHQFPENLERKHRRAGMLNIRFTSSEGCGVIPENVKASAAAQFR